MTFRQSPYDVVEASRRVWLRRWDERSASGNAVFTAILRSHQMLIHRVGKVMGAYGLTFPRYEVLAWLAAEPSASLPLGWISEVLRIPPATVTNLVDRLVADGLVRRVPHPHDARTTLAEITERGREVVDTATAHLNEAVYRPLGLSQGDRNRVVDLLQKLRAEGGEFDVERSDARIAHLDSVAADGPDCTTRP